MDPYSLFPDGCGHCYIGKNDIQMESLAVEACMANGIFPPVEATPSPDASPAPQPLPSELCPGDSDTWDAGYGSCSSYAPGEDNNGWCDLDEADGLLASQACPCSCEQTRGSENDASGGGSKCMDTDDGATDSFGDGCALYNDFPSWCGWYDDDDFDSMEMCCVCGGGGGGGRRLTHIFKKPVTPGMHGLPGPGPAPGTGPLTHHDDILD